VNCNTTHYRATSAVNYFPKSVVTWQDHGRKVQNNLRAIKVAPKEEGWQLKGAPYQATHNTLFDDKAKGAKKGTVALIHEIEDNVEELTIAPTKYCMKQGVENVVIEDPNPPLTIFHKVYDFHNVMKRNIYTDQTGKVLFKSHRGIHYIKGLYNMNSTGILV